MKIDKLRNFFKRFAHSVPEQLPVNDVEYVSTESDGSSVDHVIDGGEHPASASRHYRVYQPKGYSPNKKYPVLMVLHGCQQTHRDIQAITGFDVLADQHQFIVVYPYVTSYDDMRIQDCWGWWRPEHTRPGQGEVEDLRRILEEVKTSHRVDESRVHVVGLSSGAGMAVAALTVHVGYFASGAVVSGVSYSERAGAVAMPISALRTYRPIDKTVRLMEKARGGSRQPAPLMVVHSRHDKAVDLRSGKNLRDSWLSYFGYDKRAIMKKEKHVTRGVTWEHTRYGEKLGKSVVETVFLEGVPHGWCGGAAGEFSSPGGPQLSELMWHFFEKHPLDDSPLVSQRGAC